MEGEKRGGGKGEECKRKLRTGEEIPPPPPNERLTFSVCSSAPCSCAAFAIAMETLPMPPST